VPPGRRPNAELRTREHLTETEIERLIAAAKANRHGHRDATMILLAFLFDFPLFFQTRTMRMILLGFFD
jgi:type 1 fimbriae regulatory protein FimB/type 1 fimbriae regulatory protein FimE